MKNKINIIFLNLAFSFILFIIKIISINAACYNISNISVVESRWLNNIICLGEENYRYVNFASFENGDIVLETTQLPESPKRFFYGLKKDGTPLFGNNEYFKLILASGQTDNPENGRYEGEIFIVKISNKEYIFSIGKGTTRFAELYDLDNEVILSQKKAIDFLDIDQLYNIRGSSSNYIISGNQYIFFPCINKGSDKYYFKLKKFLFSSTDFSNNNPVIKTYNYDSSSGQAISCFKTDSDYIVCSFLSLIRLYYYIYIGVYDTELKEKIVKKTDYHVIGDDVTFGSVLYTLPDFLKCIHLEGETGVFMFYKGETFLKMSKNPIILFLTYDGDKALNNFFSDSIISSSSVELNYKSFKTSALLNDIIKISNTKLCFSSTDDSKQELYVALIDILGKDIGLVIRYYILPIYSKYKLKFMGDMRLHLYKNFAAFAFSFCRQDECENRNNEHFAGFMMFSYPNGTDYSLNLADYLFYNNIKIDNIIIDLKENVRIDNNIFGMVYSGIKIKEINNCSLFSTLNENEYINVNSILAKNEKIKLHFNSYNAFICSIKYIYIVTEPDFEEFNRASDIIIGYGTYTSSNFRKDIYESRNLEYYIKLDEDLISGCNDRNCELCLKNRKDNCITCNYNFTIEDNVKTCIPNPEIIETTQPQIDTTLIVETTQPQIDTTLIIETTQPQIDTTLIIETTILKEEPKPFIETTEIIIDNIPTTQITEKPEIKTEAIEETNKESKEKTCSNTQILHNECENGKMTAEQVSWIYDSIKNNILSHNYTNENTIIQTENVVFQISTFEDQKNNDNPNISSIDLGKCESILRTRYNISENYSLIIVKTDIKSEDLSSTYVQYDVYNPITLKPLNLSFCDKVKIEVNVPVNLAQETAALYDSLSESGYNLFDSSSDFYNDICSTYTSPNGTDMTLSDRKNEIYSVTEHLTMCQTGCELELYNKTTKKAKCNCDVQINTTETDVSKIDFSKPSIASSFLSTLKNSNFYVLKCYKLALSLKNILKNNGRIIMTIIYFFFIISILMYIIYDRKKIHIFINEILKNKTNANKNNKIKPNSKIEKIKNKTSEKKLNKKNEANEKKNKKKEKSNKNKKPEKNKNKKVEKNKNKKLEKNKNNKNKSVQKNKNKKIKNSPPNKNKKKNIKYSKDVNTTIKGFKTYLNSKKNLKSKVNPNNININIIPIHNINYGKVKKKNNIKMPKDISIFKTKNNNENNNNLIEEYQLKNLNDQELNTLEYRLALIIDKRTYFQYYWSLLKKKQLILFVILPAKDYNLLSLKIALFLLSFSLYFTINGFFFSDETMHKIHEDNGAFNIIYQIQQILYSSIISAIINMILKLLSLSESNILAIKQQKNLSLSIKKSKSIENYITFKFILFFILSNILLLFFWYFISCFCAVYTNTQIILIKDTLFSFGLSMLYPFGLNLIPGMLRIPALRDKNKDKQILYKISTLAGIFL